MRIVRHDLSRVFCLLPKSALKTHPQHWPVPPVGVKTLKDGWSLTIRDYLNYVDQNNIPCVMRRDVLLTSIEEPCECGKCGHAHTTWKQYAMDLAKNGAIVGDIEKFSSEDLQWGLEESNRCWAVALREPLFMKYYYD